MVFSKLLKFFQESIILEENSRKNRWLQRIDPRVKIISTLLAVTCTVIVQNITVFPLFFLAALILVLSAGVSLKEFLLRSFVFISFFALIIALPLPFITSGVPVAEFSLLGYVVTVTGEGVYLATAFILRVWAALSLLNMMVLTTSFDRLISAFSSLRLPKILTLLLDLTLRFIFEVSYEAARLSRAQDARMFRKLGLLDRMRSVAPILSGIFIRSYRRADRVYNAMIARGFDGKYISLKPLKLRLQDVGYFIIVAAYFIMFILVDREIILREAIVFLNSLVGL